MNISVSFLPIGSGFCWRHFFRCILAPLNFTSSPQIPHVAVWLNDFVGNGSFSSAGCFFMMSTPSHILLIPISIAIRISTSLRHSHTHTLPHSFRSTPVTKITVLGGHAILYSLCPASIRRAISAAWTIPREIVSISASSGMITSFCR